MSFNPLEFDYLFVKQVPTLLRRVLDLLKCFLLGLNQQKVILRVRKVENKWAHRKLNGSRLEL